MEIRNIKLSLAAVVAAGVLGGAPITASAVPIEGAIGFGGVFVATGGTNLADATGVNILASAVLAATGDFIPAVGNAAIWTDFSFNPLGPGNPVSPLWTVTAGPTTFSFDLEDISIDVQSAAELNLSGSGTLMATGFDDTAGIWTFSGDQAGQILFSFSSIAVAQAVAEPGTLLLLGMGLLGLVAARRRA